jgi:hypothetical protein
LEGLLRGCVGGICGISGICGMGGICGNWVNQVNRGIGKLNEQEKMPAER